MSGRLNRMGKQCASSGTSWYELCYEMKYTQGVLPFPRVINHQTVITKNTSSAEIAERGFKSATDRALGEGTKGSLASF